jgi:hypothetical protein
MVELLKKLIIPPDQNGYGFVDPEEVLMVRLEGGASKFRRDILNSNFRLNVQWTLNSAEYTYFRTFYNTIITRGSDPFLLDLYVDDGDNLTEHQCYFIPGSTGLKNQNGKSFIVSATLEVHPIARPLQNNVAAKNYQYAISEIDITNLYSFFGDYSQQQVDIIDNLINVEIPADLV